MRLLVQYHLLMILVSTMTGISASRIGAVYVDGSGNDTLLCGSSLLSCGSIGYSIRHRLRKTGGTIFVSSSTPVLESKGETVTIQTFMKDKVTSVVILRETSQRIRIVGMGSTSPVIPVKADYFFVLKGKILNIHITFINVKLVLNGGLFHANLDQTFTRFSLKNSTIEHKRNPNYTNIYIIDLRSNQGRTGNCHFHIEIENCIVQKLKMGRGFLAIEAPYCDSELTIVNTTIKDNDMEGSVFSGEFKDAKGTIKLINVNAYNNSIFSLFEFDAEIGSSINVSMVGCIFAHNRLGWPLMKIQSIHSNYLRVMIQSCVISHNSVSDISKTSLIDVYVMFASSNHPSVILQDTYFEHNDVGDSVIKVVKNARDEKLSIAPLSLTMDNVTAMRNRASVIGVKIKGIKCTMSLKTYIEIQVRNSRFENNCAYVRGGAISVLTASHPMTIKLRVVSCTFKGNAAGSTGGAIYSTGLNHVKDSTFDMNEAKVGGAVYFTALPDSTKLSWGIRDHKIDKNIRNAVQSCIFVSKFPIFWNNANLKLSNVSMNLNYNGIETIESFKHDSALNVLEIEPPFKLNCGVNKNLKNKLKKKKLMEESRIDSRFLLFLSMTCIPCEKGRYSAAQGLAEWVRVDGENKYGLGFVVRGMNSYLNTTNVTCSKCPMGGNCEEGAVRSRPNYWGYKVKDGVSFSPCPTDYCSDRSEYISSCATNRMGDLCGQCVANKTLSVTLSCVDPNSCSSFLIIVASVLIPCLLLVFIFAKEEIVAFLKRQGSRVKKCVSCDKDDPDDDTREGKDDEKSVLARIKLLLYYFQIQSLIYVENRQGNFVRTLFLQQVKSFIGSIAMLEFNEGTSGNIASTICLLRHSTYVHYKVFSLLLKLTPIIVCMISYVVLKLCISIRNYALRTQIRLPFNLKTVLLRFQSTAFQILMLFFIPISSDMVQLLNCVYIEKHGEKLPVLFGDAAHVCLQPWQYVPLLFLIMYVLPFCFALYVGSCFLQQNRFVSFSTIIIFPWSCVYYHLMDKYLSCQQCSDVRLFQRDAENGDSNLDEVPEQKLILISEEIPTEMKEIPGKLDNSSEFFFRIIQENYNVPYWPTIVALRNLAVAGVPLAFKYDYSKTLSMTLILFVYILLLVSCKPFKDTGMTILEGIIMSMLIFLGVISVINITFLTSTDNNIQYFLKIVDVLRYVFFVVPVLTLVILLIVEKVREPQDKEALTENRSVELGDEKEEEKMEDEGEHKNEDNDNLHVEIPVGETPKKETVV